MYLNKKAQGDFKFLRLLLFKSELVILCNFKSKVVELKLVFF